jgi:hypothetical protein
MPKTILGHAIEPPEVTHRNGVRRGEIISPRKLAAEAYSALNQAIPLRTLEKLSTDICYNQFLIEQKRIERCFRPRQ